MLVLSRKRGSEICIGTDVVVKVLSVRNQQVTLGIEAPPDVRIWRGEIAPIVQLFKSVPKTVFDGKPRHRVSATSQCN